MNLRQHQQEVVDVCREILNGEPIKEIVLSVTPGGGKSFVPVILAENLIPAIAEKICWVVPRNALKYQGEAEFCDPRWQTKKRIRAADNGSDLSRGFAGYVTTYQAIGIDPGCHAAEFQKHKYILFLDEFHHIAEGSEWYKAIKPLVDNAALVVKASGTLSRGDGQKIAFLDYHNGELWVGNTGQPESRWIFYSRKDAIRDKAIMPIRFDLIDGEAEWKEQDGTQNASALSGDESAKALFSALRTEYAEQLLRETMHTFAGLRQDYPEAKLLVVAPNIELAKQYCAYLDHFDQLTRIATSEDTPLARKNIEDFKRGVYQTLVTVAMAYEGLNVPDVSCICCLSHVRSVPWLEQCFARANRLAPGKKEAVVIAPSDWLFLKAVRMIEQEQLVPLKNPEGQQELIQEEARGKGSGTTRPWIIPVSSKANVEPRVFNDVVTPLGMDIISGKLPVDMPPCPPSEAEKILRKNINGVISYYLGKQRAGSKMLQQKMLYRRLKQVCDKPVKDMDLAELQQVWQWLREQYGQYTLQGVGNNHSKESL
jgi:superfamily II DNA or RNA helicase